MADRNSPSRGAAEGNGTATEADLIDYRDIAQETKARYLNYAMSVIMARALPDVRDGLKPVQRRILFAMYEDGLDAQAKHRKCAKICGDCTGNYHPHSGDAVYEALVRLAQDFTLRYPLIHGWGNFGSIMGLPAAAQRYTEARLTAICEELLAEIPQETVEFRPNYDATRQEPVVLPARFPNLLVNGTQGIAVGMATNLPPHNLDEVIRACRHAIENPEATTAQLCRIIKGPDFPLGGRIVSDRTVLRQVYEEGRGSIRVRAEWKFDVEKKKEIPHRIVVHSIPYGVETGPLMEQLGALVAQRKLPQLADVADESDGRHGIRIVLELKPGSEAEAVMSYLFKHTSLEQNFGYNATCLVPDAAGVLVPRRLSLAELIRQFLDFRLATVRRRIEHQLRILERRLHILAGFEIIFDGLDKALRLIRASRGKADAAEKLKAAFGLDDAQADAVLELALYRISSLELDKIREERREKEAEAGRLRGLLASNKKLWKVVDAELEEIREKYGDKRRSTLGSSEEITEFDPQAYIVKENTNVVLTRDGWIKRVGRLQSIESTRVREGDAVLAVLPASTLDHVVLFSSDGVAYTLPVDQVPASSGYGEPVSKHVKLADGAAIIAGVTTDVRFMPADFEVEFELKPGPYLFVATRLGQVMRIPLQPFRTPSNKSGRRYCRLAEGDRVVEVVPQRDATSCFLCSTEARVLHFEIGSVPVLSGAGKGVRGIKLEAGDSVLGAVLLSRPSDVLRVKTSGDKILTMGQMKYALTSRGGRGVKTSQRSKFLEIMRPEIELVDWSKLE